jgi:serine/threonine-protein kinase RIO1
MNTRVLSSLGTSGSEVNGCVSTGKEANVYHASTPDGRSLAIKVFKTSILVFKDRDRYVSGDFRFRNGYGKNNPRKMVKTWAEKEMRNLIRMKTAGMNVRPSIVPSGSSCFAYKTALHLTCNVQRMT